MIFTGPSKAVRTCTIYSPNITTNGAMMDIPSGTQDVILYCICTRNDNNYRPVSVDPTTWFISGTEVTRTTASGNNPYTRNNVPSPLIIPLFSATHVGTYGCASELPGPPTTPSVTIGLALSGIVTNSFTLMKHIMYIAIRVINICKCHDVIWHELLQLHE